LAIAYNKTKQFDESIRCSEKALSLNPNHHEPYGSLADSLVGKGCLADAEKWYLKCIEINKDFDVAYLELAKIYRSSNPTEAIKYFENYI
jgi:tetratricopeptide (TPR) repeat protein